MPLPACEHCTKEKADNQSDDDDGDIGTKF